VIVPRRMTDLPASRAAIRRCLAPVLSGESRLGRRELLVRGAAATGLLCLAAGCGSSGQGTVPVSGGAGVGGDLTYPPVDALLRSAHAQYGLSAVLCGVCERDRALQFSAMGNSTTEVPATTAMHMRVGGVTLTCLCVALLRLVDRGSLSLDYKLSRWLPQLPQSDKITLRMLANSTGGIPDYVLSERFQDDFYKNPFRSFTPQDLIDYALAMNGGSLYPPGTGWNYSHTSFVILGEVLQKATGQPTASLLGREVFAPLGLRDTDFADTAEIRQPVLHAFSLDRKVFEDSTYWNPSWTSHSGLMTSNLADLGVLARAIGSGSLLSEKSRQEQVAPTTVGLDRNVSNLYYGLGIILMNGWLVQNPRFGGYNLIFAHLPSRHLSIVLSTTKGPTSDPDTADSTLIFKDVVKVLTPDIPIPDGV